MEKATKEESGEFERIIEENTKLKQTIAEYELAHREMREQLQKVVSEKVNLVNQIKRMEEGNITVVPDGLRIR